MAAKQQQIVVADLLCGLCQSVSGCKCISAAECTVGQEVGLVAAESKSLFQYVLSLRRAHAYGSYGSAVLFLELYSRFNGICVEGVYHALHALALEVAGFGIELNVVRIGNLLYKN